MAYRPLKRVLGESSLERKCLLFFGSSLLLLICGAFFYVERITEDLVWDQIRIRGQGAADLSLIRHHHDILEVSQQTPVGEASDEKDYAELIQIINRDLPSQNYEWEILALEDDGSRSNKLRVVSDEGKEREMLKKLQSRLQTQLWELAEAEEEPLIPPEEETPPNEDIAPVSEMAQRDDFIYYYQPVYWKPDCTILCHYSDSQRFVFSASDVAPVAAPGPPLRVVRVTIPRSEVTSAFSTSRAFLLAAAIVTVFLSIVALFLALKHVVLKPLNYLRDVSDEISRGNTQLRAEINTNDEFEDLAASFNRMLRHLGDAQQALRDANTDLDGKVDELAQANMQLHEMNRLKSEFLANMSHELRTPLNSILGFSDVLKSIDSLNDKQKRYVTRIRESGSTLLDMINDILDLAKVESGKMEVKLSEFDIGRIVNAQCDILRPLSDDKNIDLLVEVEENLPPIFQDQAKLQQILMNLLSNAIKFTPEGGRITVRVSKTADAILDLSVEDTGIGIPEEDHQVIFEKFRQASDSPDNLTREYSGTGLGLSIVKELCKLLGGTIRFESELGKGSLFTASIPWSRPEQTQRDTDLAIRLEEATKPQRLGLQRLPGAAASETPSSTSETP